MWALNSGRRDRSVEDEMGIVGEIKVEGTCLVLLALKIQKMVVIVN